jgi:molybdopterin molybdotransferase
MAQLSDDCFAFGGKLLDVDAAAGLIADRVPALAGAEPVKLRDAIGRVLAEDLRAPIPLPPFFNSAVDGYAFRHADLAPAGETRLVVAGRLQAGAVAGAVAPGAAIRIFTGAPMPDGADTVMMQEDAVEEAGCVILPAGLKRGANCRPAGEDLAERALALPAGRRLTPPDIGLAAALGLPALTVRRRLRVGVFSTGDELVEPGQPLGPAQTYDSNRFTLLALLQRLPVEGCDLGILPDDRDATASALRDAAATHDLLLTSGGVSTGEADHVKAALEAGGRLVFWRLSFKPGAVGPKTTMRPLSRAASALPSSTSATDTRGRLPRSPKKGTIARPSSSIGSLKVPTVRLSVTSRPPGVVARPKSTTALSPAKSVSTDSVSEG